MNNIVRYSVGLFCALGWGFCSASNAEGASGGIEFVCADVAAQARISADVGLMAKKYGIPLEAKISGDEVRFNLSGKLPDSTVDIARFYQIKDEKVNLAYKGSKPLWRETVSQGEILAAMLMPNRKHRFETCSAEDLRDHVAIRQNAVAWTEKLEWGWPDGSSARWSAKHWQRGTPKHENLAVAFRDAFVNQKKYAIGCYTAAKLVFAHAVTDYYSRKGDKAKLKAVYASLMSNKDPLVGIEPSKMWAFMEDYEPNGYDDSGKIMSIEHRVQPNNLIPGDWFYLLNTDYNSFQKTGYEGSNSIYLGRNRIDDFYNDNNHFYTFEDKINEVYQWRNGVFSHSRDKDKVVPLTRLEIEALKETPEKGGIMMPYRVFPKLDYK